MTAASSPSPPSESGRSLSRSLEPSDARVQSVPDLFGALGLDLDGSCPSCARPLDERDRGGYCEECR